MKSDRFPKTLIPFFLIILGLYLGVFHWIEGRRVSEGPWTVAFETDQHDVPQVTVSQGNLGVRAVRIRFPGERPPPEFQPETLRFHAPRPVPYSLPFGTCIFEDLTFQPGTVTMNLYGHEIELLPRTLIVNKKELAWQARRELELNPEDRILEYQEAEAKDGAAAKGATNRSFLNKKSGLTRTVCVP